jgi:hypothetical protein
MSEVFQQILNQPNALSLMRAEMVELRLEGVAKDAIYATLQALRSEVNDAQEDILLEAMDVLVGFCRLELD